MSQDLQKINLPLSGVVICLNEQNHIARCLESLSWLPEIIVVDGFSTDKTKEIVNNPNAAWKNQIKWIQRAWDGFKNQRNFSITQATHPWVLILDSDEACSLELQKTLTLMFSGKTPNNKYFKIRRQEYFLNKPINFGIWNPSYQDRLFFKEGISYVNEIHEYPKFPTLPDLIHEPILHAPGFGPDYFLYKMNKYTTIEAQNRFDQGVRTNPFRMISAFPAMFLKNYFYYSAYKDGIHGFAISILEGISRAVRHIKIWQIQTRAKANKSK